MAYRRALLALSLAGPLLALGPSAVDAQYAVPSGASQSTGQDETRRVAHDESAPRELAWETGAGLVFVTSEPSLGGRSLKFTDAVLLRTHFLVPLGASAELFAGLDLLPKQPASTGEPLWQGALVGGRLTLLEGEAAGARRLSTWARGQLGPLFDDGGLWGSATAALELESELTRPLFWTAALGAEYLRLFDAGEAAWAHDVVEPFVTAGVAIRDERSRFGLWLTFGYHLPVAWRPDEARPDPGSRDFLDPKPRVNVDLGAFAQVSDHVRLFATVAAVDRGDLHARGTTLPVLNGGFDQTQIAFGFMAWREKDPPDEPYRGDPVEPYDERRGLE